MSDKAPKDSEQHAAEADVEEFKRDLGPFVIAAETTRMPMVFTDAREPDHPIIFANDAFLKLTGYDRDEVMAQSFNFLLGAGTDTVRTEIEAGFADDSEDTLEICVRRKDGSALWASLFVNPVRDEAGEVVQHFVSLVDDSRHHDAQDHAEMMIEELNHRVKNTLATVQSIVTQAVRNHSEPAIVRESIESRIGALSRSHDLLSKEKWGSAGLRDLAITALAPFGVVNGRSERFTIEGENIRLSSKAALALGIGFHELATNAVKYGALSNEAGSISNTWSMVSEPDGRWLCLHWREKDGPPVVAPARRGFGSRVIEQGLAHELGGRITLDYRAEGIVCTIYVPAPHVVNEG